LETKLLESTTNFTKTYFWNNRNWF